MRFILVWITMDFETTYNGMPYNLTIITILCRSFTTHIVVFTCSSFIFVLYFYTKCYKLRIVFSLMRSYGFLLEATSYTITNIRQVFSHIRLVLTWMNCGSSFIKKVISLWSCYIFIKLVKGWKLQWGRSLKSSISFQRDLTLVKYSTIVILGSCDMMRSFSWSLYIYEKYGVPNLASRSFHISFAVFKYIMLFTTYLSREDIIHHMNMLLHLIHAFSCVARSFVLVRTYPRSTFWLLHLILSSSIFSNYYNMSHQKPPK